MDLKKRQKELNDLMGDLFYVSGGHAINEPNYIRRLFQGKSPEQIKREIEEHDQKVYEEIVKLKEKYGI